MDEFKKIFLFLLKLEEHIHVHLKIKKFQKWQTWKIPWFTPTLSLQDRSSKFVNDAFA